MLESENWLSGNSQLFYRWWKWNERIFNFTLTIRNYCLTELVTQGGVWEWQYVNLAAFCALFLFGFFQHPASTAVQLEFLEGTSLPSPFTVHLWTCHPPCKMCLFTCTYPSLSHAGFEVPQKMVMEEQSNIRLLHFVCPPCLKNKHRSRKFLE